METNKQIKIYGTLVNQTLDSSLSDNTHNDVLAYASQLYDDRFGATPNANNFQDIINKRLTGITYDNGVTTIDGNLVVTGNCTLNGDALNVLNLFSQIDTLQSIIIQLQLKINEYEQRITALEGKTHDISQFWSLSQDGQSIVAQKPAHAPGFYDTSIS